ncbi:hypothetical protein BHE74_00012811 [Ensete ventricosum]|nr:hypothetical protein BHE74_00012811 [Ensete ventricosum]
MEGGVRRERDPIPETDSFGSDASPFSSKLLFSRLQGNKPWRREFGMTGLFIRREGGRGSHKTSPKKASSIKLGKRSTALRSRSNGQDYLMRRPYLEKSPTLVRSPAGSHRGVRIVRSQR